MNDLDSIIAEMYDQVCFEPGQRPDWGRQAAIFAPGARMVRVNDSGVFEFDMESYRVNFEEMIASGEMPSFWEGEIWRETRQSGGRRLCAEQNVQRNWSSRVSDIHLRCP